jgi:hypothetical protein
MRRFIASRAAKYAVLCQGPLDTNQCIEEIIMKKVITTIIAVGVALILSACASTGGAKPVVLPLDHGPRAQTTPWENQQRQARIGKVTSAKD